MKKKQVNYNFGGALSDLAPLLNLGVPGLGTLVGTAATLAQAPTNYKPVRQNESPYGFENGGPLDPPNKDKNPYRNLKRRRIPIEDEFESFKKYDPQNTETSFQKDGPIDPPGKKSYNWGDSQLKIGNSDYSSTRRSELPLHEKTGYVPGLSEFLYNRISTSNLDVGLKSQITDVLKDLATPMDEFERTSNYIDNQFFAKYLGLPSNRTPNLVKSPYKPSQSKDKNSSYYTLNDLTYIDPQYIVDLYNYNKNKNPNENTFRGVPSLTTKLDFSGELLRNSLLKTVKGKGTFDPLMHFTISKGKDDKGTYLSIYDKYDLKSNPVEGVVGKPFEFYDRIYIDDNSNIVDDRWLKANQQYEEENIQGRAEYDKGDWIKEKSERKYSKKDGGIYQSGGVYPSGNDKELSNHSYEVDYPGNETDAKSYGPYQFDDNEVIDMLNQFVYSDEKHLGEGGKSPAELVKPHMKAKGKVEKKLERNPYDEEAKNTAMLSDLAALEIAQLQESKKAMANDGKYYKCGGKLRYEQGGPIEDIYQGILKLRPNATKEYGEKELRKMASTIYNSAYEANIPYQDYTAQLFQESGFSPDVVYGNRRSSAGAKGIAQLMPETEQRLGVNALNPYEAIPAGAEEMSRIVNKNISKGYGADLSQAAQRYNVGGPNFDKYKRGEKSLPTETQEYPMKIGKHKKKAFDRPQEEYTYRGYIDPELLNQYAATAFVNTTTPRDNTRVVQRFQTGGPLDPPRKKYKSKALPYDFNPPSGSPGDRLAKQQYEALVNNPNFNADYLDEREDQLSRLILSSFVTNNMRSSGKEPELVKQFNTTGKPEQMVFSFAQQHAIDQARRALEKGVGYSGMSFEQMRNLKKRKLNKQEGGPYATDPTMPTDYRLPPSNGILSRSTNLNPSINYYQNPQIGGLNALTSPTDLNFLYQQYAAGVDPSSRTMDVEEIMTPLERGLTEDATRTPQNILSDREVYNNAKSPAMATPRGMQTQDINSLMKDGPVVTNNNPFKDFTLGDALQGVEALAAFRGLGRGPEIEPLYQMQNRQIDDAPIRRQIASGFNAAASNINTSSASGRNAVLSNLYANRLRGETDALSQLAQQNKQLAAQTEQFNLGQRRLTDDMNARNRAAFDQAQSAAFQTVGNVGRGLNKKKQGAQALKYLEATYPDVFNLLMAKIG